MIQIRLLSLHFSVWVSIRTLCRPGCSQEDRGGMSHRAEWAGRLGQRNTNFPDNDERLVSAERLARSGRCNAPGDGEYAYRRNIQSSIILGITMANKLMPLVDN